MDGDARLEQLDETLEHLERLCGRLEHAERHFKQLTDDCQGVLQNLVALDRRHSSAVAGLNDRLGDWCNLESKLLEESARRIEQFERGVSHEWMVLRQLNEEPIADMREQADTLRRTCLEAARMARLRLEAAEQAYSSHAAALEQRMVEWQRRWIDAATSNPALAAPAGVEPWPLEGVAQLHQELRTIPEAGGPDTRALLPVKTPPARTQGGVVVEPSRASRQESRAADDGGTREEEPAAGRPWHRRGWLLAGAAVIVAVIVLAVAALSDFNTPAPVAPQPSAATVPAATPDSSREQEERLVEAQRLVERAGSMVDILAAPDLLRYGLTGTGPAAASYAQVLWSRSRGIAVTASRLAAAPPGRFYVMWVVSDGNAAPVGELVPDASGRASLVIPGPLTLPRLVALRVTLEDSPRAVRPTGPTCLAGGPTP